MIGYRAGEITVNMDPIHSLRYILTIQFLFYKSSLLCLNEAVYFSTFKTRECVKKLCAQEQKTIFLYLIKKR